jgi:hypothetical protein
MSDGSVCASVYLQDLSGVAAVVEILPAALEGYIRNLGPVEIKLWSKEDLQADDVMRSASVVQQNTVLLVVIALPPDSTTLPTVIVCALQCYTM